MDKRIVFDIFDRYSIVYRRSWRLLGSRFKVVLVFLFVFDIVVDHARHVIIVQMEDALSQPDRWVDHICCLAWCPRQTKALRDA
jgi:hypothetical protein